MGEVLQSGQASFKMTLHVVEKQNNKNHYLRGELVSLRDTGQLRMDLSATTLGVYVGSLSLNDQSAQLLLPRQKQFYEGAARPEFLWRLAKVPLSPKDLQRLVWGDELSSDEWDCELIAEQQTCQNRRFALKITQTGLDLRAREFHFEAKAVDVHLKLNMVQTKVELTGEEFTLSPPRGFTVRRLN